MSVSALGNSQQVAYTQYFSSQSVNNQSQSQAVAPPSGKSGNSFALAIASALTQLGSSQTTNGNAPTGTAVSGTSGTSGTNSAGSTTQTPEQALQAFVQSLLAALQSQVTSQSSGSSGSGHHHHGGGLGKIESGIQNLISQLSSGSSTTSTTTTNTTSGNGSSALSALQSSFNNLVKTDGISGSSATLTNFLQNLETNLQGSGTAGNVVHTSA